MNNPDSHPAGMSCIWFSMTFLLKVIVPINFTAHGYFPLSFYGVNLPSESFLAGHMAHPNPWQIRRYDTLAYTHIPLDAQLIISPCLLASTASEPVCTGSGSLLQPSPAENIHYSKAVIKQNLKGAVYNGFAQIPFKNTTDAIADNLIIFCFQFLISQNKLPDA